MKIAVTEAHIENGTINCQFNCPLALALKENYPDWIDNTWIYGIDGEHIWFRGNGIKMPKNVRAIIKKFDNGEKIEPFEFDFDFEQVPWRYEITKIYNKNKIVSHSVKKVTLTETYK